MSKPKPYRDLPLDVYSLTAPRIINGSLDLDEKLKLQLVVRPFISVSAALLLRQYYM